MKTNGGFPSQPKTILARASAQAFSTDTMLSDVPKDGE